jgi:hypothetical protein
MPRFTVPDKGFVNGVELFAVSVTSEVRTINPQGGSVPDHGWTSADSDGHFHAFDADGALPTLERRTRPCPGGPGGCDDEDGCDPEDHGYQEASWFACVICGDEVKPRYRRADMFEPLTITGIDYTAHVYGPARLAELTGRKVTLQIGRLFTVGTLALREFDTDGMRGEIDFPRWSMRRGGTELAEQRRPIDLEAAVALDPRGVDFAVLVARTAVEAALPHLRITPSGEAMP